MMLGHTTASEVPQVLVIGTASLDTLHLPTGTVHTIGGAGLYTALAARAGGVTAGLLAPVPDPLPDILQPVMQRLSWYGPIIAPADMPRLEIAHHGDGRATLLKASWGAEPLLTSAQLPLLSVAWHRSLLPSWLSS